MSRTRIPALLVVGCAALVAALGLLSARVDDAVVGVAFGVAFGWLVLAVVATGRVGPITKS